MAKETRNPDYIVYFVSNRKNTFWTRLGAAWTHRDGKGLNIETDFVLVGDGRFVLRDFEEVGNERSAEATGESA